MEIETSEQLAFIPEQVESVLMGVIDGILRTEVYLEEKVKVCCFSRAYRTGGVMALLKKCSCGTLP